MAKPKKLVTTSLDLSEVIVNRKEATAHTQPNLTVVPATDQLPKLDQKAEQAALKSFAEMLDSYLALGINRREALQKIIIHSVWFQFSTGKCQLIQKVLVGLSKDTEFNQKNLNRVIFFYQKIAGFRIHQVGLDFQVKRVGDGFLYNREHLDVCKLSSNCYWELTQADPEKPYKSKDVDALVKGFTSQLALLQLVDELTAEQLDTILAGLKSKVVTAMTDPKVKEKSIKTLHSKNAPEETWASE